MKTYLLYLSGILFSTSLLSQPILTNNGINPVSGETYKERASSSTINPGNGGANQNWSFSTMPGSGINSYTFTPASSTPYAANFSPSDLGKNFPSGYEFIKTSPNAQQVSGSANQSMVTPYYDFIDRLRFPLNFNDSYTGTCGGISTSGTYTVTGTYTVSYDAYGTLSIPNGSSSTTLNDVMRIHFQANYMEQTSLGTENSTMDDYSWYANGIHHPVAYTFTLSGAHPYSGSGYSISLFTSVDESERFTASEITVYPNPATATIYFKSIGEKDVRLIEGYDITGKLCFSRVVAGQSLSDVNIDIYQLDAGVYFIKFIGQDQSIKTKKFLISR